MVRSPFGVKTPIRLEVILRFPFPTRCPPFVDDPVLRTGSSPAGPDPQSHRREGR